MLISNLDRAVELRNDINELADLNRMLVEIQDGRDKGRKAKLDFYSTYNGVAQSVRIPECIIEQVLEAVIEEIITKQMDITSEVREL